MVWEIHRMHRISFHRNARPVALLLAVALVATGCKQDEMGSGPTDTPSVSNPAAAQVSVKLTTSSANSATGSRIVLALEATAQGKLTGLQGALHYNPRLLRYVGQGPQTAATLAIVNAERAGEGLLPFMAVNSAAGLSGRIAPLVFEVLGAGYASGLRYEFAYASVAGVDAEITRAAVASRVSVASDLAAPASVKVFTVNDWAMLIDPSNAAEDLRKEGSISYSAGQRGNGTATDIRYGDVNLSGTFTGVDVAQAGNAALGRTGFGVIASDSTAPNPGPGPSNLCPDGTTTTCNKDFVIAGNVRPVGPPIGGADPNKVLNVLDVQALQATFLAGGTDASGVVNTLIRPVASGGCTNLNVAAGTYIGNITWNTPRPCWVQLDGVVRIGGNSIGDSAAVLTIAANTLVRGNSAQNPSALFIQRQGQINAIGTAGQPIEFTCTAAVPAPGCWGGIYIAGNATVNEAQAGLGSSPSVPGRQSGGANQRQGEGGAPVFGGNNDLDNSGTIQYASILYAGFLLSANNELNCLTFGGVGSGTTIDHVQCHRGSDDTFEFFGGTVDARYLVGSFGQDDNADISFGYNGRIQYMIVLQGADGDKGVEADNTETAATFGNLPPTSPEIYNVTFVGRSTTASPPVAAFHLRNGTAPEIGNALAINYPVVLEFDQNATCLRTRQDTVGVLTPNTGSAPYAQDSLTVWRSRFSAPGGAIATSSSVATCAFGTNQAAAEFVINSPQFLNNTTAVSATSLLIDPFNVSNPDLRPVPGQLAVPVPAVGSLALPGARAGHISFDQAGAAYYGAVPPASATLNGLPWYSGWTRFP
jgi:hypothetical protein